MTRPPHSLWRMRCAALPLLALLSLPARAQLLGVDPAVPADTVPQLQQVLGGGLGCGLLPTDGPRCSLAPVWAARYGRYQIGGSRARGLLGPHSGGSGLSALVHTEGRWRLGLGLRLDGRQAADDALGRPGLARTVRLRAAASATLASQWSVTLGLSQDLLGHGGGALLTLDAGRSVPLGPWWDGWSMSVGLNLADARYLRARYTSTGLGSLPAYHPGAGPLDLHAGLGKQWPLGERWLGWAQVGVARLLGPAAASPVTLYRDSLRLQGGLAWRWD